MAGLVFVIGLLLVGGLLFLGASLLLGRGETQPPAEPERSPVQLPEGRAVVADDVRALRISVTVRGYRMTEVDWLLDQLASVLDDRDAEIAALRAQLPAAHPEDDQRDTDPGGVPVPGDGLRAGPDDDERRTGA
ncbi:MULTISPECIES: DivIVA domain-containing protein [unclassified Modestobacter]|uniref:DivIVA domain-containing protein n=1 Tax=unclassified Modestobacter TaxID=2643866 RepID=UPI0022AABDF4|nr:MULTISPECIES: DivIVA domain-containing protein [unclassified Modestobacter]MCZ2827093.1 DivIVA domain-containing protein [Modestobacter sp. VKM Ac-2981]MCZ2854344.1 DivIVA domain-containing protein [Modestobacter sp. VKM Ac-2982]